MVSCERYGFALNIIDTPGFVEGGYINEFLLNKTIDVFLYVDRLDAYRKDNLDKQIVKAITKSFDITRNYSSAIEEFASNFNYPSGTVNHAVIYCSRFINNQETRKRISFPKNEYKGFRSDYSSINIKWEIIISSSQYSTNRKTHLESVEGYASLIENVMNLPSEDASPRAVSEIPSKIKKRVAVGIWEEEKSIQTTMAKKRREDGELRDRSEHPRGTWEEIYRSAKKADRNKNDLHERDDGELQRTGQPLCIYEPYFGQGAWPFLHHESLYRGFGLTSLSKAAEVALLEDIQGRRHGDALYFWVRMDKDPRNPMQQDFWTFCDAINAGNCKFAFSETLKKMYGVKDNSTSLPPMPMDGDSWSVMHSWSMPTKSFLEFVMFSRMFVDALDAQVYDQHHHSGLCYLSLSRLEIRKKKKQTQRQRRN
ncbi:unnamed protein product [Lactuca virosa]|uniref:Uncharacterized protein n=1 Tax=Lactuca virosa TaxID=75947 RepID=A0AAU9M464_9ASTR|nr:unnamed protein product [Lactuca virosa]